MSHCRPLRALTLAPLLLLLAVPVQAQDFVVPDSSAKSSGAKPASPSAGLVDTRIELDRGGHVSQVNNSHPFRSGDRIVFVFTPRQDGYVYWLHEGTNNYETVWRPAYGADGNRVRRNQTYRFPEQGALLLDDNKGVEKISLVLADQPIPQLDAGSGAAPGPQAPKKTRNLVIVNSPTGPKPTIQGAAQQDPKVFTYDITHQ